MQAKAKSRWRFDPNALTVRDVLIIAPVVVVMFILSAVFASRVSDDVYIRWGGLALDSAVLLGFVIYYSRDLFRTRGFWIQLLSGFIVHLAAWIIFLSHVGEWKLAWFSIMVFEVPAFFYLRDWPES